VTWKQAAHALSDPDGLAESLDPFYVPDRTREVASFLSGTVLAAIILCALFFVPLTTRNLGLLLGWGMFAALALYRGLKSRRYRLSRAQVVTELRARLLTERGSSPLS
jgi:hypothetical protein